MITLYVYKSGLDKLGLWRSGPTKSNERLRELERESQGEREWARKRARVSYGEPESQWQSELEIGP